MTPGNLPPSPPPTFHMKGWCFHPMVQDTFRLGCTIQGGPTWFFLQGVPPLEPLIPSGMKKSSPLLSATPVPAASFQWVPFEFLCWLILFSPSFVALGTSWWFSTIFITLLNSPYMSRNICQNYIFRNLVFFNNSSSQFLLYLCKNKFLRNNDCTSFTCVFAKSEGRDILKTF